MILHVTLIKQTIPANFTITQGCKESESEIRITIILTRDKQTVSLITFGNGYY